MGLISLQDVSKLYGFGGATTVALDEVNLDVDSGEFIGIMGPSGSGKSTLLYVVGLIERPSGGVYKLSGRSVEKLSVNQRSKARRDKVGFVFQSFNLIQNLNALENVALPLQYRGMTRTRRLRKAAEMLERVGLTEREYFLPRFLSGGEAQRVAIARSLINDPDIIIADEPTGNLDSASSRLVMELLSDLHASGSTVLLVTHNPELTRYASRVVFMRDGGIVADERSILGDVPAIARGLYFIPKKTVDDDISGVSELMKVIPAKVTAQVKKARRKKSKPKAKKYKLTETSPQERPS